MVNKPTFTEADHSYINPITGERYISVTTLLHRYEPKKDWDAIVKKYVDSRDDLQLMGDIVSKYAVSPDELKIKFDTIGKIETVKEIWSKVNKESCEKGTAYHKQKEAIDLAKKIHVVNGKELPLGIDATYVENLYDLPDGIYTELLVWNNDLGIAGQADKIIIYTEGDTRYVEIEDYKTNKEIKQYNYLNKSTGKPVVNEYLLAPVERFCNCNYYLYQLQLNMYGWLLTQFGFKIRRGKIIHVTDNDKAYPLLNLQAEVGRIVTHYKDGAKRSNKKHSSEV